MAQEWIFKSKYKRHFFTLIPAQKRVDENGVEFKVPVKYIRFENFLYKTTDQQVARYIKERPEYRAGTVQEVHEVKKVITELVPVDTPTPKIEDAGPDELKFQCGKCDLLFPTQAELDEHVATKHAKIQRSVK